MRAADPNLGVDDRNQYDLHYSLPGGLATLRSVVADFKAAGVRVLWPYNPWDQGTRSCGTTDTVALNDLIERTDADGFNGDTMDGANASFYNRSVEIGHPIVIEPESMTSHYENVATNVMSYMDFSTGQPAAEPCPGYPPA